MPQQNPKDHKLKAVPKLVASASTDETDDNECPVCFGTGMEIVPGKGARICSCRKLRSRHGQFENVRLPRRYDGFHFGNYKPQNESQIAALKNAMNFTMEYPAVDRGLLFMGSVGVGKTHLAIRPLDHPSWVYSHPS